MSLEAAINRNNELLEQFIAAVANFTGAVAPKDKIEPPAQDEPKTGKPEPKAEKPRAKAAEPETKAVSRDEVKKMAVDLMKAKGRDPAIQIFSRYKAANLGEIADKDLAAVYADIKAALGV